ncbi:MAG TPA: hypothetical protein VEU96_26010 [Bryobacteraceae bacterium]|nr:hypothetical protein [Bryobacteraceae bacterium]
MPEMGSEAHAQEDGGGHEGVGIGLHDVLARLEELRKTEHLGGDDTGNQRLT